mgnify:FL=1
MARKNSYYDIVYFKYPAFPLVMDEKGEWAFPTKNAVLPEGVTKEDISVWYDIEKDFKTPFTETQLDAWDVELEASKKGG